MLGLGNSLIAGSAQLEKQSNFSFLFYISLDLNLNVDNLINQNLGR